MTKFRLANPCQNKESKHKKHDKLRDKRNANECLYIQHILLFWNVADPAKPLTSHSAQINFDIIWNGSCSAMHDRYIS